MIALWLERAPPEDKVPSSKPVLYFILFSGLFV